MSLKKIAAIQMTSSDDVTQNLTQAAHYIEQAAIQGAEMIVLPEMFVCIGKQLSGWNTLAENDGEGPIQTFLSHVAHKHRIWLVAGTIPLRSSQPQKSYASSLIFNPNGDCVARYDKQHLFDVIVTPDKEAYQESDFTIAGDQTVVVDTPLGRLGIAVCYDIRFPSVFTALADEGCEIVALPAAFTAPTGIAHWETLIRARALDTFSYVVAAAQTGIHAGGRKTYGHSMIVGPWGNILQALTAKPGILIHEIDHSITHTIRQRFGFNR